MSSSHEFSLSSPRRCALLRSLWELSPTSRELPSEGEVRTRQGTENKTCEVLWMTFSGGGLGLGSCAEINSLEAFWVQRDLPRCSNME